MKKLLFIVCALTMIANVCWSSSSVPRHSVGIQTKGADGDVTWAYDATAGLILSSSQLQANAYQVGDGAGLGGLIDGVENWFHSSYDTNNGSALPDADHFLQVDISSSPLQRMFFTFVGRNNLYHDTWDDVDIYGTNDNAVGEDVNSAEASWTLAAQLVDLIKEDTPAYHFASSMIDLGASYKFLRFVVRKTTSERKEKTYGRYFWALDEFQVYAAYEAKDSKTFLTLLCDSLVTLKMHLEAGTNPGFWPEDKVVAFNQALDAGQIALTETHSESEYAQLLADLRSAFNDIKASQIPMQEGYYNFVNGYDAYMKIQSVTKSMTVSTDHFLAWKTTDIKDAMQVFKVTAINDTAYSVQNICSGEFIETFPGQSKHIPMGEAVAQTFNVEPFTAQWHIANEQNPMEYHTEGHLGGKGVSGLIVTYPGGYNSASVWYLNRLTDQALIDSLTTVGPKSYIATKLNELIDKAGVVQKKIFDYQTLITNADDNDSECQFSSNAKEVEEGSYAALIDNNTGTFFHTFWSQGGPEESHNLQVDLKGNAVQKFKFKMIARGSGAHDFPTDISIYATNNEELGADASSDLDSWTPICQINEGFPIIDFATVYNSPEVDMKESYRYVRFVVNNTSGAADGRVNSVTGFPYFNLSEFQMYKVEPSATSEYYQVTGMKEASDKLDNVVKAMKEKIANLTVEMSDTTTIIEAIRAVDELYVDRSAIYNEMQDLLAKSEAVIKNVKGDDLNLIVDAEEQCSSNAASTGDSSSFANLIDGDSHHSHNFHTVWKGAEMQRADITPDEWAAVLKEYYGGKEVGSGYHNLQVELKEPVSSFRFEMTGRYGTSYTDTPNNIEIYATNDAALGASTNQADLDSWTLITKLTEGFPEDVESAQYASPEIEMGANYKFIRFVVKGTTHMSARVFNSPDVTGITWNVGEFQMYGNIPENRKQYNYIAGMKEAIDVLEALVETDKKFGPLDLHDNVANDELRAALDKVMALYVDTTDFVKLCDKYMEYIANSVVGEGIGFVDAESSITDFQNAVNTAKSSFDRLQPSVESVDAAMKAVKDAFDTFMTHVEQIKPNTWYNIVSNSTREFAVGQPIFLGSTSTGAQLKIGGYPITTMNINEDPYAIWRFVPIEGKEGEYAIQSLGTGQYFGAYRGQGADKSPLMSHTKTPYKLFYYGNGGFKMQQVGVEDEMDCLKTDGTKFVVLNYPANGDHQQSWGFQEIEVNSALNINYYFDNSIQIMTLPFDMKGDLSMMELNEGVYTYGIKSITPSGDGTILDLQLQNDIEAGVPFIIRVNDYESYDGKTLHPLILGVPETVTDTSAVVANGLVGTLEGITLQKPGMGIFKNSVLDATTANAVKIEGREGYINPNLVEPQQGATDLSIVIGHIIDGVNSMTVVEGDMLVDVYTLDGKLVKSQVKASEATKGLKSGIYIINKKKVLVR